MWEEEGVSEEERRREGSKGERVQGREEREGCRGGEGCMGERLRRKGGR